MITDTTFFANERGYALLDGFKKTLKHVKYFDVLVGYFRTSGFHQLCESFESINKIKILVGLNIDQKTYEIIESIRSNAELDFEPKQRGYSPSHKCGTVGLASESKTVEDSLSRPTGL